MKLVVIASSILAFSALAAAGPTPCEPEWSHDHKGDWKGGKGDKKGWGGHKFSSTFKVVAKPDQVINGTTPTPGEPGAVGYFKFAIDNKENKICYDITLHGVTGEYQSPAKTATHIHQAKKGASGPPRIAFPNPEGDDKYRRSKGCLTAPFTTGVLANGVDTGTGFHVKQIEEDPSSFFCDTHTKKFVPGAVRGQLA